MIKYAKDYNPIMEYWNDIESGKEVVSNKIYRTYKKVIYDLTDNTSRFYYSNARANHVIEFIENYLKHSKGKFGGKPVILELWEKAMLATIFGFIDTDGNRKYRRAILIIGKNNGKSLLASCVGLYLMVGDSEAGAEIYSCACKKDQAKIIWQESKKMVKKSPALRKRIKTLVAELNSEEFNDGIFKPLSSESDTLDGLNIHGGLMDEFWAWKNGKALYDIIADGVSAREQPLIFMTSTAGTVREDIYDDIYAELERLINGYFDDNGHKDDRTIGFVYELDNKNEWTDPNCWKKANPALGTVKNLVTLTEKVEQAKKNPKLVKNILCKEFDIRETSSESWLTFDDIYNPSKFTLDKENKKLILQEYDFKTKQYITYEKSYPRYAIGGCDLSRTSSHRPGPAGRSPHAWAAVARASSASSPS
jgi:phage terminase large subunit-like protein